MNNNKMVPYYTLQLSHKTGEGAEEIGHGFEGSGEDWDDVEG